MARVFKYCPACAQFTAHGFCYDDKKECERCGCVTPTTPAEYHVIHGPDEPTPLARALMKVQGMLWKAGA